jgi:hypothetical protein
MSSGNGIGTLKERSLHAGLKDWLTEPGDEIEKKVNGYFIDIVRGDLLIEIQTKNFSALKKKLTVLVKDHPVKLVYPISRTKWIQRVDAEERKIIRRKSPRKGRVEHLFQELFRIPQLVLEPNFHVEVLFTEEEEIWRDDGKGSWRRKKWSISDRRLLGVVGSHQLSEPSDYLALLPETLPEIFSNRDLQSALKIRKPLASKMSYCLRKMGLLTTVGKAGNANLFSKSKIYSLD